MVLHSAQEGSWIKFDKIFLKENISNDVTFSPNSLKVIFNVIFCLLYQKLLSYLALVPSDIRAYFSIPVLIIFRISFFNGCEQENILHVSLNQRQNSDFGTVNQYFFLPYFLGFN
jgi:hypothetical protein